MKYDFLIVGAGITGITISRKLAEAGKKVLIVEQRNHACGNCYDEHDEHGILIHKYGPHIFHTNYKEVWNFLSRFTDWVFYQHRVSAYIDGKLVPFPINLDTINQLYNFNLTQSQMAAYLDSFKIKMHKLTNSKDSVVSKIGIDLYEKFFENYTFKQWGIPADELDASVCARIPVRFNRDVRYFTDKYQGIPRDGYRKLFERMLYHDNISLLLQAAYRDVCDDIKYEKLVYTGPIDEHFDYCHGRLGYRSLYFDFRNYPLDSFQHYAVVNYPNDYDFTRITEYKKFTAQKAPSTTVSYEYPCNVGDPYYPIPTSKNHKIYEKYHKEAKKMKNVFFAGRLGAFRYMNMDVACLEAMDLVMDILR